MRLIEAVKTLRAILWCLVPVYLVFFLPGQLYRVTHDEAERTRVMVRTQLDSTRADVSGKIDAALLRVDVALAELNATETAADARTEQALGIVQDVKDKLLDPQTGVLAIVRAGQTSVDTALNGSKGISAAFSSTAGSLATLSSTYSAIPAAFSSDRRVNGLIDQSMGLIAASKVTAGQIAIDSRTFTVRWPALLNSVQSGSDSLAGIAANGKRVTDKALAPCLGQHPTAVSRAIARTGCVFKGTITVGAPVAIGLARAGVL